MIVACCAVEQSFSIFLDNKLSCYPVILLSIVWILLDIRIFIKPAGHSVCTLGHWEMYKDEW